MFLPERLIAAPLIECYTHARMNPNRSASLDLLRLFACLLVIGRHAIPKLENPGPILAAWERCGWIGVDLFFTLSGWLIGGLLLAELRKTGELRIGRFLWRRALKIYPAYYALLAYTFARTFASGGTDAIAGLLRDGWSCLVLAQNYLGEHYPWGHTWSLAVEEHFYLTIPFVLLFAFRRHAFTGVVVVCAGLAAGALALRAVTDATASDTYTLTHFRIDALALGVAARALYDSGKVHLRRVYLAAILAIGAAPIAVAVFVAWDRPHMQALGYTLNAVAFCALLIGLQRETVERVLAGFAPARWCASVGALSYSIYIWHLNAIGWTTQLVHGHPWAVMLAIVAGCILVGWIAARIVESPVLRFRDAISRRTGDVDACHGVTIRSPNEAVSAVMSGNGVGTGSERVTVS